VIGLLILEAWRASGKRVAVLTSSNALADDMARRCEDLGLESAVIIGKRENETEAITRVRNKRKYARNQAIGIMNYWAYMMGRDIPTPDVLVIDDADFFENFLTDHYSVTVSREDDARIWNELVNELARHRIYQAKLDTLRLSESSEEAQLVYFTHSVELAKKLRTLVLSGQGSQELTYSFDRNDSRLETYLMFVMRDSIVFTPFITPGLMHDRLKDVETIVFMSATIGSRAYIHRTLGADIELKLLTEKDVENPIATMGRRIIFPLDGVSASPGLDDDVISAIVEVYEAFGKALIICNSHRDANKVSNVLNAKGYPTSLYKREVDSTTFAKSNSGALITAGRFIGLDLPDESCRVAIVPTLPFVLGPTDSFARNQLEESDYIDEKVRHRLVQAFGRCNRNSNDFAVYFVLDSRLANDNQAQGTICALFPKRMRAELDYGQDYAETGGVSRCIGVAKLLLANNLPDFEREVQRHIQDLGDSIIKESEKPYRSEIDAWHELTVRQNYIEAAQRFSDSADFYRNAGNDLRGSRQSAWMHYLAGACHYLAYLNYQKEAYKSKVIDNLRKGLSQGKTSWFSGLQLLINELSEVEKKDEQVVRDAETWDFGEKLLRIWEDFSLTNTSKRRDVRKTWEGLTTSVITGKHDEICDRLRLIFELMGFEVHRNYDKENEPDLLLFATTGTRYVCLVEVKTKDEKVQKPDEIKPELVGRDGVDQIGGHKPRYQTKYSNWKIYPILYTNKEGFSEAALSKARDNVRLLRSNEFVSFLDRFFELMEKGWKAAETYERGLVMAKMPMPAEYEGILSPKADPMITIEDLLGLVKW
jgi:hypothetical protein